MFAAFPRIVWLAGAVVLLSSTGFSREIWLDVPFVRQSRNGCGSACIAMIMRYWDSDSRHLRRESEAGIYRRLYSPAARGIPAVAMERYLKEQGFRVFVFNGNWNDLQEQLSKSRPLIVCLKEGAAHYLVVAGIDTERGIILVNDPARRKLLKLRRSEFERDWRATGNWILLALP